MKQGSATPLPPSYPPTGVGLAAEYHDIIDIIDDIWAVIAEVEDQLKINYNRSLETKLNYYYDLSEWWEDVYLVLVGKEVYDSFF